MILDHQGNGTMTSVLMGPGAIDESVTQEEVKLDNYTLTVQLSGQEKGSKDAQGGASSSTGVRRATIGSGGIIISVAPDEFLLLTAGVDVAFCSQ
jgi:hypothetical protein